MNTLEMIQEKLGPKLKGQTLTLDSAFKDLKIDSLDLADMVFEFESEFDVQFEDDELMSLKTVADVVALIEKKVQK